MALLLVCLLHLASEFCCPTHRRSFRQDEYRKHIEKDPALERRFQQVYVSQPSVTDTISILRGLKDRCRLARACTPRHQLLPHRECKCSCGKNEQLGNI